MSFLEKSLRIRVRLVWTTHVTVKFAIKLPFAAWTNKSGFYVKVLRFFCFYLRMSVYFNVFTQCGQMSSEHHWNLNNKKIILNNYRVFKLCNGSLTVRESEHENDVVSRWVRGKWNLLFIFCSGIHRNIRFRNRFRAVWTHLKIIRLNRLQMMATRCH